MAKAGERENPFAKDHLIKTNAFLPMEPINTKTISFYIMYMAGILNRSGVDSLLLQSLRGYQHPEQNISWVSERGGGESSQEQHKKNHTE